MALEFGSAMHEVFAAARCWQLARVQRLTRHSERAAHRIFGAERWKDCYNKDKDERDSLINTCFNVIHSGEFYDDEQDQVRTVTNLERGIIRYADETLRLAPHWHVYVANRKDPDALIGIEHVFDITLEYDDGVEYRYVGTVDGILLETRANKLYLGENKTGYRLDDTWREGFKLVHQCTGYCVASTTILGKTVFDVKIFGLKTAQSGGPEDFVTFEEERTLDQFQHWARWLRFVVEQLYQPYRGDVELAPRFTHSCTRYFRPCALIPFCHDTQEGRALQLEEMVNVEPSPSEKAIAARNAATATTARGSA
jgi:hypothetical protein